MPVPPFFPYAEYRKRLEKLRQSMQDHDLDGLLVSIPENIYYLVGVNHWGFFSYHMLVVPRQGELTLIARAMETVTMEVQLTNARFFGYTDYEDQADVTVEVMRESGLQKGKVGLEKKCLYLPPRILEGIITALPGIRWEDASDLVLMNRVAHSENELNYFRQAAIVSDAMFTAAYETAHVGVREKEVAAEVLRAMVLAGGEHPGFGPFIRSTPTLGQEHGTWNERVLEKGDALFLEMSGSVARYHSPMGRLVFIGEAPHGTKDVEKITLDAFDAVVEKLRPGVRAGEVYQAWQDVVDRAGMSHYRRHHCGYMVSSAFPPSWSGPGVPIGLRKDSPLELCKGMVFHVLSWLMGCGWGDYFVSNSAIISEDGGEVLTKLPSTLRIV
jgi:Xaa-Pro dipeptidase